MDVEFRPRVARPRRGPSVGPITPHLFEPTAQRPVRAKNHRLAASTEVVPHTHAWAQLAYSAVGVLRLVTPEGSYITPPSRAVYVPPGVEHAITVIEDAELRTLYLHPQPALHWSRCRVLEVSELLRAAVLQLDTTPDEPRQRLDPEGPPRQRLGTDALARERLLADVVLDELRRARAVPLGVPWPADKRLRALCEAVLADPARHATLDGWAAEHAASARTLARLFRRELGTSFGQWRQQVLLARALAFAAERRPMGWIAAELGYASASAFSAMVRRAVGAPPSRFFASAR
jgi:AraC-like DNA-binding protein/quercetin dioxygenase-like cupin family protein